MKTLTLLILIFIALNGMSQIGYKIVTEVNNEIRDTVVTNIEAVDSMVVAIFKQPYSAKIALKNSEHFGLETDYTYLYCEKRYLNDRGKWRRPRKRMISQF